jgi:hypothetical protein
MGRRMALAHHSVLRLEDDRVLAPSSGTRRRLARSMLALGRDFGLLCARAVDTHLHHITLGNEPSARELSRRLALSLGRMLGHPVSFLPPRIKPIRDQWHLVAAFKYVIGQERHHAVSLDPFHDASTLPDLLGMRVLAPWLADRVAAYLPRLRVGDLWSELELAKVDLEREPLQRRFLADAASAAFGLETLRSKTPDAVLARRAAIRLVGERLATAELAELLLVDQRSVRRLRGSDADPRHIRAIRLQLAARSARARLDSAQAPIPSLIPR